MLWDNIRPKGLEFKIFILLIYFLAITIVLLYVSKWNRNEKEEEIKLTYYPRTTFQQKIDSHCSFVGPRQWIRLEPWTKLLSPRIFAKLIPRIYHQLFTHNFQTRIFEFSRLHWGGAKVLVSPAQTRSLIHRTKNAAIKYPSSYPRAPSSIPAESLCIDAPRISRDNIATRTLFPSYESLI